jgi:hypothetical protein
MVRAPMAPVFHLLDPANLTNLPRMLPSNTFLLTSFIPRRGVQFTLHLVGSDEVEDQIDLTCQTTSVRPTGLSLAPAGDPAEDHQLL